MKFKPSFRALSPTILSVISILYTGLLGVVYSRNPSTVVVILFCGGFVCLAAFVLLRLLGVFLVVFYSPDYVLNSVRKVYDTMGLDYSSERRNLVLDRSGIRTKVISITFMSLIMLKGGKPSALKYITSVIKKFINYRHN